MAPQKPKKSKVRVIARLRPERSEYTSSLPNYKDAPSKCVRPIDSKTLEVWNWRNGNVLQYQFDGFFGEYSSQKEIYHFSIKPVLQYVLQGENSSVFAYGPTGAGKTHTMLGTHQQPGVIPRCLSDIFIAIDAEKQKSTEWTFETRFSYLEIYQEKVNDLLDTKKQDLPIRQDNDGNIFIPTLTENVITSYKEFDDKFQVAAQNRKTASTKLNPHSSRSHSILLIKVQRGQTIPPFRKLTGKMYLIDLAGSEDNRRTGNEGVRLKESGAINGSLFALGQVVDALNNAQPRIPYRNSKLTRLLQDSLGGSAHTCVIANLAPEPMLYSDTLNTLNFATKSRTIVNKPFIRESYDKSAAFKRPHQKLCPEDGERPAKSVRTKDHSSTSSTYNCTAIPSGVLSPFRIKQDILEERMEALERRLLVKTEHFIQKFPEGLETARHSPFKDVSILCSTTSQESLLKSNDGSKSQKTSKKKKVPLSQRVLNTSNEISSLLVEENFTVNINPALQEAYDSELLSVLNNGDVKDLTQLEGIGKKRAGMILDWRSQHGSFTKVLDLALVNGLTFKMADTFRKKNLLNKMIFT